MANLPIFEIVFAETIVLYHHYCAALSCIATPALYCNLHLKCFKQKPGCELKLAADGDNAILMLIWSHCHFQQENVKVSFYLLYTGVKVLKMRYLYTVIKVFCSSSTSI